MSDDAVIRDDALFTVVGATGILLFAGTGLVLAPYLQLERVPPTAGLTDYTTEEAAGREAYVSLGCVYCHSQQPRDPSQAPDLQRGWGRPSTPGDYAFDYPHQLGTMRTGPDLFNVGARLASADWHLVHLYQPRAVAEYSVMPAYPFLFEHKEEAGPNDVVVNVPEAHRFAPGVVVAKPEALELTAYLLKLDHTAPLYERGEEP